MQPQFSFFLSIAFSFIAWVIVSARYIWPELRLRQRAEALRPLLILHSFRFIGLAFLVPGVVSPDLPSAFAHSAAYGDIIAATLARRLALFPAGVIERRSQNLCPTATKIMQVKFTDDADENPEGKLIDLEHGANLAGNRHFAKRRRVRARTTGHHGVECR
jgi:hypothetical protein